MDSLFSLTKTRLSQLEALAQDDCTKKMLNDRLADITGRLFVLTWSTAAENLANKKTSRLPAMADPCRSLLARIASTTVSGYAGSAFSTERASLTINQDPWLVNQTNGSYLVEEAPLFNLTQWNTTANANSTAMDTYMDNLSGGFSA